MKLIPRIANKTYKLGSLHTKFGDPRRVDVVLLSPAGEQVLIEPTPELVRVTPQQLEQFNTASIRVLATDYQIKEVPRFKYPDTLLTRCRYLIDAVKDLDGKYSGRAAEFRYLDDRDALYFTIIVSGHINR